MKKITFNSHKDVTKSVAIFFIGVTLNSSTNFTVNNLQPSLNIEGGLGVTSLAVFSSCIVIAGVIICPTLMKFITARTALIISDFAQLVYTLTNFYPVSYTLIPASVVYGFGRALFWTSAAFFSVYYANKYMEYGKKSFGYYFSSLNAYLFAAFLSGQMFGSLIPYAIFEIADTSSALEANISAFVNLSLFSTTSSSQNFRLSVQQVCGANDCQEPSSVAKEISKYKPKNKSTLYLLLGVLACSSLLGTLLHFIFAPRFQEAKPNVTVCDRCEKNGVENAAYVTNGNEIAKSKDSKLDVSKTISFEVVTPSKKSEAYVKILSSVADVKKTFAVTFRFQQLLIAWYQFHMGSSVIFLRGEVTRAYISCVYGVAQVGISMSIYGASLLLFSTATGKASAKYGRKPCIFVGCVANLVVYITCLLWVSDENTSVGFMYALMFVAGISDAVSQAVSSEIAIIHFPNDTKAAYANWLLFASAGYAVQYSWSTYLCVGVKIYIQLFLLSFAIATLGVAEYRLSKGRV